MGRPRGRVVVEAALAKEVERLIALLLRLAESEGKQTPQGIEFNLPVSHQELASQLGTVRELVSRAVTPQPAANAAGGQPFTHC